MNATKTQKQGPVHSYWLYSDGGGMLGPFTKNEARAVVKESPAIRFRARRNGEVRWQDAEVRLAQKKSATGTIWLIALAAIAMAILGAWWSASHNHGKVSGAEPAAISAPETSAVDVASGS